MLSIIVVTYNRKILLNECLNSILSQDFEGKFEVIIIDNGSCDGTEEFLKNIPERKIKFISNKSRLDLASCKTLGINASSGEIIAFTDDDCRVAKDWLKTIESSLVNRDVVGGPVLALPGTKFPRWWSDSLHWLIGINLKPNRKSLPLGSNIAFKKHALLKTEENKTSNSSINTLLPPYAEDNCRVKRALACGFSMSINQKMTVYHHVPKERLTIAYLIKRSYDEGVAWAGYEEKLSNLFFCLAALPYNLVRLLISLDMNRFFYLISNFSYILNYIKKLLLK